MTSPNLERALATYAAMQRFLYAADGTPLYREAYPGAGGNPYAYVWPFSRALVGTLTLAGVTDGLRAAVQDRLKGLAAYWMSNAYASYVVPPLGQGGDTYYDDNVWIGLALVELSQLGLLPDRKRAQQVFELGRRAWDRQSRDPSPGGIFWVEQGSGQGRTNHDRGAGLTAGYAKLGLLLQELTGTDTSGDLPRTVGWQAMLDWVDATLDSGHAGVGPYWNVLRRDGSLDTNLWPYVQGEMLAARSVQYRLTREQKFLDRAEGMARQTLATFGQFTTQPPSFNAMCFQAMLLLSSLTSDAALRTQMLQTIHAYADWAWDSEHGARDPRTNLFHFTSAGTPAHASGQPALLQDQGAMLQIYALLAWDADNYPKLT